MAEKKFFKAEVVPEGELPQVQEVRTVQLVGEQEQAQIEVAKSNDYRTIIVNGLFGGHRPGFIEAIVYTEEMTVDDALETVVADPSKVHIRRTLQARLLIDPVEAKRIARWLARHISEYENKFGKIVVPEDAEERQEKQTEP